MECCNLPMRDWSFHRAISPQEKISHFYCKKCGRHYHDGRYYSADEWFFYINEMNFQQHQQMLLDAALETPHAHEHINH